MLRPVVSGLAAAFVSLAAQAETMTLDDFSGDPSARWEYVSDRVMGGVSDGGAAFAAVDGRDAVRLVGTVSTENNGGFIQVRRFLPKGLPEGAEGLTVTARGNGETYFVHLRTKATTRPWYYYQAEFTATADWSEVRLPLSSFAPSNAVLPDDIDPETVTSVGLVAFGRDYRADLSVASLAVY